MQQQSRRIRQRRSIALAAVAALAASATAACSSSSTAVAKATPASKELVYWSMWQQTEPQAKVIQKALDSFGRITGVKVTVQWKGRTVLKDMANALKNGQPSPDLVDGSINTVTADLVVPGRVLDLTPM
jgi:ABC-type glycerol-3-phosphate transport system substrate-binding protein